MITWNSCLRALSIAVGVVAMATVAAGMETPIQDQTSPNPPPAATSPPLDGTPAPAVPASGGELPAGDQQSPTAPTPDQPPPPAGDAAPTPGGDVAPTPAGDAAPTPTETPAPDAAPAAESPPADELDQILAAESLTDEQWQRALQLCWKRNLDGAATKQDVARWTGQVEALRKKLANRDDSALKHVESLARLRALLTQEVLADAEQAEAVNLIGRFILQTGKASYLSALAPFLDQLQAKVKAPQALAGLTQLRTLFELKSLAAQEQLQPDQQTRVLALLLNWISAASTKADLDVATGLFKSISSKLDTTLQGQTGILAELLKLATLGQTADKLDDAQKAEAVRLADSLIPSAETAEVLAAGLAVVEKLMAAGGDPLRQQLAPIEGQGRVRQLLLKQPRSKEDNARLADRLESLLLDGDAAVAQPRLAAYLEQASREATDPAEKSRFDALLNVAKLTALFQGELSDQQTADGTAAVRALVEAAADGWRTLAELTLATADVNALQRLQTFVGPVTPQSQQGSRLGAYARLLNLVKLSRQTQLSADEAAGAADTLAEWIRSPQPPGDLERIGPVVERLSGLTSGATKTKLGTLDALRKTRVLAATDKLSDEQQVDLISLIDQLYGASEGDGALAQELLDLIKPLQSGDRLKKRRQVEVSNYISFLQARLEPERFPELTIENASRTREVTVRLGATGTRVRLGGGERRTLQFTEQVSYWNGEAWVEFPVTRSGTLRLVPTQRNGKSLWTHEFLTAGRAAADRGSGALSPWGQAVAAWLAKASEASSQASVQGSPPAWLVTFQPPPQQQQPPQLPGAAERGKYLPMPDFLRDTIGLEEENWATWVNTIFPEEPAEIEEYLDVIDAALGAASRLIEAAKKLSGSPAQEESLQLDERFVSIAKTYAELRDQKKDTLELQLDEKNIIKEAKMTFTAHEGFRQQARNLRGSDSDLVSIRRRLAGQEERVLRLEQASQNWRDLLGSLESQPLYRRVSSYHRTFFGCLRRYSRYVPFALPAARQDAAAPALEAAPAPPPEDRIRRPEVIESEPSPAPAPADDAPRPPAAEPEPAPPPPVAQLEWVRVHVAAAVIRDGTERRGQAVQGQLLPVLQVRGPWLGTVVVADGQPVGGWVWEREVEPTHGELLPADLPSVQEVLEAVTLLRAASAANTVAAPGPRPTVQFVAATRALEMANAPQDGSSPEPSNAGPAAEASRLWTDDTGRYTVQAELVEIRQDQVFLRRPPGDVIVVSLNRFSAPDREYLRLRRG